MYPADIARRFDEPIPPDNARREAHRLVRAKLKTFAVDLAGLLPEGREKSLVITHLEEAMFWANAAIARADRPNERFSPEHGWPAGVEEQQDRQRVEKSA